MEYLPLSLTQCLEIHQDLPLQIKYSILLDVAKGLNYLHCKRPPIVHRDLTANNILLTSDFIAKISDLGVSRMADTFKQKQLTKAPGNAVVMPPEALEDNPSYDYKLDVFSYGCLILHVFTHQWPIPTAQYVPSTNFFQRIRGSYYLVTEWKRRSNYTTAISSDNPFFSFAKSCLDNNPKKRPTMNDAIICAEHAVSSLPPLKNTLEMMKNIDLLTERVNQLERQVEQEKDQAQENIHQLEQEKKQAQDNICQLEQEKEQAQDNIRQLEQEKKQAQDNICQLEQEKEQTQDNICQLEQEKKQAQDNICQLEQEKEQTQDNIHQLEQEKKQAEDDAHREKKKAKQLEEDKHQLIIELTKSWQVKVMADVHLATHEKNVAEKSKLLDQERSRVSELQSSLSALQKSYDKLQSVLKSKDETIEILYAMLKSNNKDIEILRAQSKGIVPSYQVQKEMIQQLLTQELKEGDEW